jgi:enoyl-CoA hydratase/carnithine racemase
MTDDVYLEASGGIATIVLNRPHKRNALTFGMWQRLPELLAEFETDPESKVLILRGAESKAFSAGADISEFETLRATPEDNEKYNAVADRAQETLATLTKPTIALVQGACVGGGCGLAVSCDLRLCGSSAMLAITPAKLGIVYPVSLTKRLVDLVGPARTKAMLFTGAPLTAQQAYDIGLVDQVHDPDVVEAETVALAETIASRAPYSIRATKHVVSLISAGLTAESDETLAIRTRAVDTDDYREGVRAFLEKRPAVFTGH